MHPKDRAQMMAYMLRPADGGRAAFKPGGVVTKKELTNVLGKAGVVINPNNFAAGAKDLGIKQNTKDPNFNRYNPKYIEPTKKQLKKIKVKQDKRILQNFKSGPGREAYLKREKRIIKLLKEGKLTLQEIDDEIRKKFGKSSMTTILKIKKDLNVEIPSGIKKGIKNPKTAEIINDLNILKNNKQLNDLILKPDFSLIGDISELEEIAEKALPKSKAEPMRRVGQLMLAYSGEDPELKKYVGKVSNDLAKASEAIKFKMLDSNRLLSSLQKQAAEKRASTEIGKTPAFFGNIRKRIGETLNKFRRGLNIEIDEVKAIGGARAKTAPYNIFVQGIKGTINQEKGNTLDKATQRAELELQNATTKKERESIKNEYNQKVKKFVKNANKNLKPGQLPVRALEISFDKPSETIKNKQAYKQYKNMFDDIYSKHRYSFKVPKDVMTGEQAKTFLKTKEGRNLLTEQINLGSQRLFANPFFSPGVLGEAFKSIPTPLGAVGLTAGFGIDPTSAIDRASIAAEAAFAPQLVKQAAKMGAAQRIFNLGLTPAMAARVARIASPLGIASLGAEGLYQAGKFTKKRMGELKAMTPEQRQQLRAEQSALAFEGARDGGLIGKKSGPPPEKGPNSQGLPGLLKRGMKI